MSLFILDNNNGTSYPYTKEKYKELKEAKHDITLCAISVKGEIMSSENVKIKIIDEADLDQ